MLIRGGKEEVVLFDGDVAEHSGCGFAGDSYRRYFNEERAYQGIDNRTPDDVFLERKPPT